MANINEQLQALYESKKEGLGAIEDDIAKALEKGEMKNDDYSFPLLMYCWEKEYLASKQKLLFVGQETNKWWADAESFWADNMIAATTGYYKEFALGKNHPGPFWQAVNIINQAINPDMSLNFLWTNICKFGRANGSGRPHKIVRDLENEFFNVFADEVKIVSPDAVIFFTGPNYDADILDKLGETKFEKCTDADVRAFARVVNEKLPEKSFRTYHPRYLRESKNEHLLDELVKLISE